MDHSLRMSKLFIELVIRAREEFREYSCNMYFYFFYRHYRLEAEIASMTWKVNWCDVITKMGDSKGKRGSRLSLARQSVIVSPSSFTPIRSNIK